MRIGPDHIASTIYSIALAYAGVSLAVLMLVGSLMECYGMASIKSLNWVHTVAFVVILALTFYVIRDLEFPRLPGLVGLNEIDNVMVDLRKSMN